jgi:hypothetical protein
MGTQSAFQMPLSSHLVLFDILDGPQALDMKIKEQVIKKSKNLKETQKAFFSNPTSFTKSS